VTGGVGVVGGCGAAAEESDEDAFVLDPPNPFLEQPSRTNAAMKVTIHCLFMVTSLVFFQDRQERVKTTVVFFFETDESAIYHNKF